MHKACTPADVYSRCMCTDESVKSKAGNIIFILAHNSIQQQEIMTGDYKHLYKELCILSENCVRSKLYRRQHIKLNL